MQIIDLTAVKKEHIENHTSKGNQPKWHIGDKWYKADHMGYEALAEYVVSELLKKSNVENFVAYDLVGIKYDNKDCMGCVSDNFKNENEMLVSLEKLHRQYFGKGLADALAQIGNAKAKIRYTVNFTETVTELQDVGEYFALMLGIDAFFLNEDRHTNNIAVIRNEKTKLFKIAPIFDNGLSLLSDMNDYPAGGDVYENIKKVHAKPFDTDFDEQLNAAEELYGSKLKLYFKGSDVENLFGDLKGLYDEKIIQQAESVLYEQMRKYQYFF